MGHTRNQLKVNNQGKRDPNLQMKRLTLDDEKNSSLNTLTVFLKK